VSAIRVLLADDHTLVRAGIRSLLQGLAGYEVVAEVGDGAAALESARATRPDIVLMDISMKGMSGLEATARLKQEMPAIRVLILSMHASEEYVLQALQAGASGYLLKDAATLELELALAQLARGEIYLSPPVSRQVVDSYVQRVAAEPALTPRQQEILRLVAGGHSTKEIAFRLALSVKTVETHRSQLMDRLGIHDVAGLVRYAIRTGLISAEK
jgi:DNA-binding NarL/FixJ family response regulator